ncbi:MAG TPA: hypothetical protein PLZ51_00145 [Aggregatilineales bacterium]|nr:hypothetical protein [Aggregatilineales bacterium]
MNSSSLWDILPDNISHPTLEGDIFWENYIKEATDKSVHVAILANKYLESILNLDKTIESRFSLSKRMPYQRVNVGDVLLLKQTSGPIKGIAYVEKVWFYKLENDTLNLIKRDFGDELKISDESFWLRCEQLSYATLIKLTHVKRIPSIKFSKCLGGI